MSSLKYYEGETKKRPGLYNRYSNADNGIGVAEALNGVGAIAITASWGPLNEVVKFTGTNILSEINTTYGADTNGAKTAQAFAKGGLSTLYVYRVGTGGTKSSITLDSAITIEAKYPGVRTFNIQIRESLANSSKKEMLVLDGTTVLQKIEFASTAQDLADAISAVGSDYVSATVTTADTTISVAASKAMTAGTAPTVTNESYTTAFTALEPYDFNVLTIDSHEATIQNLLMNYATSAEEYGKRVIAVVGTYDDNTFNAKLELAKGFDLANMICCGSGYLDNNNTAVGKTNGDTTANAIMAGYIAAVPSRSSVVHQQIAGATDVLQKYTNTEYTEAIDNGLVLLSVGSNGEVWFDSGVTTLINPTSEQDEGWKKIKRVKTRYELFDRLDRTLEPFVGKINTSNSGTVLQAGLKVIDTMIAEGKLLSGSMTLANSSSDSVWYDIEVVDADTLEKIYLHYKFRFNQENE